MSRTRFFVYLGLISLFLTLPGCSRRKPISPQLYLPKEKKSFLEPFQKIVLDNNLTVIVKEVHSVPIVSVYFWVNTGSVNEGAPISGISHFFEHMFFKGTEQRRVGEMDRIVKELGGYNNAFTSIEYTGYYIVVPREGFEVAFDILLDAIRNSIFDEEEMRREKEVVKEEIRRKNDLPADLSGWEYIYELFKNTPYGNRVLGTLASVEGISREDMLEYMHNFYVPNNMAVVVVGDIDAGEVISCINRKTGDFLPDPTLAERLKEFEIVPQGETRTKLFKRDTKQTYLTLGFPTEGRVNLDETYPLEIIATLLGGGRSSRLYQRLLEEERIVTSIECWHWPLKRAGTMAVEVVLPPENEQRVKNEIIEEFQRLREEGVAGEELSRAKEMIKAKFLFENETTSGIGRTLGEYEVLGEAEEALEFLERIAKVSCEDVKRMAEKYFLPGKYTVSLVLPEEDE